MKKRIRKKFARRFGFRSCREGEEHLDAYAYVAGCLRPHRVRWWAKRSPKNWENLPFDYKGYQGVSDLEGITLLKGLK